MRLGIIKISDSYFHEGNILELLPMFTKFIPIHIDNRPYYRDYLYTGISNDFEDIQEGIEIPVYDCKITTNDNREIIKVEFIKTI